MYDTTKRIRIAKSKKQLINISRMYHIKILMLFILYVCVYVCVCMCVSAEQVQNKGFRPHRNSTYRANLLILE